MRFDRRTLIQSEGIGIANLVLPRGLLGEIDKWLAELSGWFIYNTRGLDDEGYGPLTASVLDRLLLILALFGERVASPPTRISRSVCVIAFA